MKFKESVCSKQKEIEDLENLEERLKKYEDDLIDLRSQTGSKNNKISSLEGRNFEL